MLTLQLEEKHGLQRLDFLLQFGNVLRGEGFDIVAAAFRVVLQGEQLRGLGKRKADIARVADEVQPLQIVAAVIAVACGGAGGLGQLGGTGNQAEGRLE